MTDSAQIGVRVEQCAGQGRVARITLCNAGRANSLNSDLMEEFVSAMQSLADDAELRVLTVTGEGERAFCGGANVHELAQLDGAKGRAFITRVHRMSKAIRDFPVPVIARVNGACLGAGLELMAACDIRVVVRGAALGMPEVKVGLPSVVEAALFPQHMGWGRTKQLIYTGKNIDADTAREWGLVEEVAEPCALDDAVEELVRDIVAADPAAIRWQKELMRSWEALPVNDAIEEGIRAFARACAAGSHREVVRRLIRTLEAKD